MKTIKNFFKRRMEESKRIDHIIASKKEAIDGLDLLICRKATKLNSLESEILRIRADIAVEEIKLGRLLQDIEHSKRWGEQND